MLQEPGTRATEEHRASTLIRSTSSSFVHREVLVFATVHAMDAGMRDENGGAIHVDRLGREAVTEERPSAVVLMSAGIEIY